MNLKRLQPRGKNIPIIVFALIMIGAVLMFYVFKQVESFNKPISTAYIEPAFSQIMAQGSIISQKQESLHFQAGGKLVYLPFAEGDQVSAGQVIASLDNTEAEKTITAAEATYRSAKAALDLVLDNIHLFQYGNGGFANVGTANETQTQKTQRQQAEEAVNVAFDNLVKARKQLENLKLVAPFDGSIIHEDIKDIGVNVTPSANFTLGDLNHLIFQAQVPGNDISYISVGDKVKLQLDNIKNKQFNGIASKIYQEKIKLTSGGEGYKVDIVSDQFGIEAKFGITGTVVFENQFISRALLVPSWVVLGNQYVWSLDQNTPKLRKVKVGDTYGDKTQILEGLMQGDKVILDPKKIIERNDQII